MSNLDTTSCRGNQIWRHKCYYGTPFIHEQKNGNGLILFQTAALETSFITTLV